MKAQSRIMAGCGQWRLVSREQPPLHQRPADPGRPPRSIPANQPAPAGFTVGEHLWVQRAIEQRMHKYNRAGGDASLSLRNWLRAEREVLAEFLQNRRPPAAPWPISVPNDEPVSPTQSNPRRPNAHQP